MKMNTAIVDDEGRFRYLVIDTAFAPAAKQILLPIGLARINYNIRRVYVDGLSKVQVEQLPEYSDRYTLGYEYEEQVRGVYRPLTSAADNNTQASTATNDRDTYSYQQDSALYDLNEQNHQVLKLYEERLITNKRRVKTGEVKVSKHVETETEQVSVPIEKERVVIERVASTGIDNIAFSSETDFQAGEVARIEVYEETPEIHKEAFVREEVRVKKIVEPETVNTEETVRREELDINTEGHPDMN